MKLTIDVEYLSGKVYSATYNNPAKVEWPPHPSRLFSAFVAAYHECGLGDEARNALEWMESLKSPSIYADPPQTSASESITTYVPVNDSIERKKKVSKKKGKDRFTLFPKISEGIQIRRLRQKRDFPFFTPRSKVVQFIWDDVSDVEKYLSALKLIAANVTYLGNSMSLVRVKVGDDSGAPTLAPDPAGTIRLRTIGKGRLEHLENVYERRLTNSVHQPVLGNITTYGVIGSSAIPEYTSSFHAPLIFRRVSGGYLPLEYTPILTSFVRRAILSLYPDPVPAEISGHLPSGGQFNEQHLHIIPMADVGWDRSDGHLLGFALLLPMCTDERIANSLEEVTFGFTELNLGRLGKWYVEPLSQTPLQNVAKGLSFDRYTKTSAVWTTVTPMVFGKHPKKSTIGPGKNGGKVFSEVLKMSGFPDAREVIVNQNSFIKGVPRASSFKLPDKFRDRYTAHIMLSFPAPVNGPLILGSGRFAGMGMFRPLFRSGHS